MVAVYIGLGSNIGQRKKNILRSIGLIKKTGKFRLTRRSSFYETKPLGPVQRDFINACVKAETILSGKEVLKELKKIEKLMGRTKTKRWGPRIIDLDLLFYGSKVIKERGLIVPHKEIQNRFFVLDPLCEIAPRLKHPALNKNVLALKNKLKRKT